MSNLHLRSVDILVSAEKYIAKKKLHMRLFLQTILNRRNKDARVVLSSNPLWSQYSVLKFFSAVCVMTRLFFSDKTGNWYPGGVTNKFAFESWV